MNSFSNIMSQHSDEKLIEIITTHRSGYQDEAIEAAEAEIRKRNIDPIRLEELKANVVAKQEAEDDVDFNISGPGNRIIHHIIDTIIIGILAVVLCVLIITIGGISSDRLVGNMTTFSIITSYLGYYILMEHLYQKTVGKFMTKTHVISATGARCSFGEIVARTFCRLIPFDQISFLFSRSGFHDYLSGTRVIKD